MLRQTYTPLYPLFLEGNHTRFKISYQFSFLKNIPVGGEMFIEKCGIQNLSSIGAVCETQKQHAAPMELDCGIMVCL